MPTIPYTINLSLTEQDFLTNQLYLASKSDRIRKKRRDNVIWPAVSYAVIALYFYTTAMLTLAIVFLALGLAWALIYPFYQRRKYYKHYLRYINENYQGKARKSSEITFDKEYYSYIDEHGDGKMKTASIKDVVELKDLFLIRLESNTSLIIPNKCIPDLAEFRSVFNMLGLSIIDERGWVWR